jgi:hypothetical protein
MGADKNSSQRRWKLQQDEHGFQHTSPTHYSNLPSPRSHWSATGPRNQHTTFRLENAAEHQTSSWQLPLSASTLVRPVRHTSYIGHSLKVPKAPNRATDLQTDPNSKQPQHRTTANTPRRSPEQKPTEGGTSHTGQEHWSDRCSLGSLG